ncbi:hypothetical protein [Methylobacterium oxalidis]|uniref:Uncharacterized protein n=1 Tax=Methylobacterium oxalidis TaxID=944322 RepID=A0A512IY72_9HYPH|nr:hypothetical protein MOX02_06990 [Methylobacterium oxalidis]GLS61870.1 hypothetical protein GCM10007888_02510 [Methylobacterium oxalidis]
MDDVRGAAMKVLPDIAREAIPGDGDRRFFTVVARRGGKGGRHRHALLRRNLAQGAPEACRAGRLGQRLTAPTIGPSGRLRSDRFSEGA